MFLAKNYLNLKKETNDREKREVIHACILIAAKMRECDIYCPLIPDILAAGGKQLKN